ncbi:Reverse transcriptase domain - like 10 [Theobroma cacao]|nr:Reverse transcriptase domain - like 10 [Theobroma cacao]
MENALNSQPVPPLPNTYGTVAGRPPDPPQNLPSAAAASPSDQPPATSPTNQPPVSPRTLKKSFLSVAAGEKAPVISPNRQVFWYKDRPAVSFFDDELQTLAMPFKHSVIGKFTRMPRMQDIRLAFKGIGLVGAYEIRWLDYKHVLIFLTNEHDFNRVWIRQVWFIANQKMRVFKWSPDFQPEKESSVVPVWISFPNLPAHLHEKSALMMVAKTVGNPLFVDEATANRSRPSVARVCVEYDCQKPPLDHVWIVSRDRKTETMTGGLSQRVEFAKLPEYCRHCCHVGHAITECMVLGNKPVGTKTKKLQQPRSEQEPEDCTAKQNPQTQEQKTAAKREQREFIPNGAIQTDEARISASKQSKVWHAVGTSGANNSKSGDKVLSESKLVQTAVSNSFEAIREENMEEQKNPEKQGQTEMNSDQSNAENVSSKQIIRRTGDTTTTADDRQPFPVDDFSAGKSNTRIECVQKPATDSQQPAADKGVRNVHDFGTNEGQSEKSSMLMGKDECQRKESFQFDGTRRGKKIENNATKESQNRSFEFEKKDKTSPARRNMHEVSGNSMQELQPQQGERSASAETAASGSVFGSCSQPLQLLQGERKASGQAPSYAYDEKTNEEKGHDRDKSIAGNDHLITVRQHKLQKKAKPILSKLAPSFNVNFAESSAALLFEKTDDNNGSQRRPAKDVTNEDNSAKYFKNVPSEPGICILNKQTDSFPSGAEACHNSEVQIAVSHPRVHRRRKSDSSLPTSTYWNSIHATDPLECTRQERLDLWNCLRSLSSDMQGPWMVGGDFNTIVSCAERLNGAPPHGGSMEDFVATLLDCGLIDAGFEGNSYTWTNNHMFQRLDRVVYNPEWGHCFSSTRVQHLNRDGSDHCPLLISCATASQKGPSTFRFLHAWTKHHDFLPFVERSWQVPLNSSGLTAFWIKQQRLKRDLKWWNKQIFGDIFEKLKLAELEAEKREMDFQQDPSPLNRNLMHKAYAKLNRQLSIEELYWQQKSGVKWLVEGERNTKFFHSMMRKKRVRNNIFRIQDSEGNVYEDSPYIQNSAVEFFQKLLRAEQCDISRFDFSLIPRTISITDNESLCAAPSLKEIKDVVFNIDKDSVAGPDGFSSLFYQQCWDIIKQDLLEAMLDFFKGTPMPQGVTSTTLVLLPKKPNSCQWSDFRPISLCTVLNKIVTKLLANRLSKILPSIISENQSGFVNGRLISDNILLAQELVSKLDAKARGGNVALKLDMAKAYDRLNWDFLYLMMKQFGFNDRWISLIKACISNCWFSLLINGSLIGYFKSERGLRQGDSISPFLFILAADYLSRGINQLFSRHKSLHYLSGCFMPISHLAFADDIIIFTNGCRPALQKILVFLQEYEKVSGQQVNHQKSCFITANGCPMTRRQIIAHTTGFQHKTLPVIYLGAPLHKGPKKVALFDSLISKIRDRISGWENKTLSPGGRITLLRSVLSSLPMFLLQVLKPPVVVIEKIERLFNSFLWGDSTNGKRIHWVAWHKLTFPCSEGGLDIRRLIDMFDAFSMKLWWRFQTCDGLWTKFLRTKYCMGQIPHYVRPKLHDSPVWKRMVKDREVVIQNTRWRIGKGNLFFWHDCWMGDQPLVNSFPLFRNDMSTVHNFFNGHNWDVDKLKLYLPMNLIDEILQTPFDRLQDDVAYWALTSNGDFSTWSAWEAIRLRQSPNVLCSLFWHKSIPLSVSFFLWRVFHNWIPVDLRLKEKGFHLASKCVCCNSEETLIHVLWDNPIAKQVWNFFSNFFQIYVSNPQNVSQILWAWYFSGDYVRKGHIRTLIPLFICWFLWLERNDAKHRQLGMYSDRVVWKIMKLLRQLQDGYLLTSWQWKGDMDIAAMWGFKFPPKIRAAPQIIHWVKPVLGEHKLNVDGSSRQNQSAAIGGLLRDHTGTLVFGFSENIGLSNSLQAELRALLRGLLLCKERNIEKLWIEMDALVAIQMVQQSQKGSHDIRYLLASIRKCLSCFSFRISHIFREGNQAADFLSNKGHTHQNLHVFSEAQGELHVVNAEKPALVPPTRPTFRYKDKPAVRFFEDEIEALAQPFRFAIVGKFSKMPRLTEIRQSFVSLGLSGVYNIRWMNYKHILIHLSNEQDFNRIWTKQTWFITNQKMRVFKWTPDFETEKESPIVPVWVSFPNLKAHLFEKSALLMIAKAIGNPLCIDEATANGTRPSVARVCIEYDCLKPPVDSVWIVVSKRGSEDMSRGYLQKVEFSPMPEYCNHCCHVGHNVSKCLILGSRSNTHKSGGKTALESYHERTQINAPSNQKDTEERPIVADRENVAFVEKRKNSRREVSEKSNLRWQEVRHLDRSDEKGSKGANMILEDEGKEQSKNHNSFAVLDSEEDDENQEQDRTEKHKQTEYVNSTLGREKFSIGRPVDGSKRRDNDVVEIYGLQDDLRLSSEDPNNKQQQQCMIEKGKERQVEKESANTGAINLHVTCSENGGQAANRKKAARVAQPQVCDGKTRDSHVQGERIPSKTHASRKDVEATAPIEGAATPAAGETILLFPFYVNGELIHTNKVMGEQEKKSASTATDDGTSQPESLYVAASQNLKNPFIALTMQTAEKRQQTLKAQVAVSIMHGEEVLLPANAFDGEDMTAPVGVVGPLAAMAVQSATRQGQRASTSEDTSGKRGDFMSKVHAERSAGHVNSAILAQKTTAATEQFTTTPATPGYLPQDEVGESSCVRRETTVERQKDGVDQNNNGKSSAAAFSANFQTVEEALQLHFHDNGKHGHAGKDVEECVNHADVKRGSTVNERNNTNKTKKLQKLNVGVAESSLQGSDKQWPERLPFDRELSAPEPTPVEGNGPLAPTTGEPAIHPSFLLPDQLGHTSRVTGDGETALVMPAVDDGTLEQESLQTPAKDDGTLGQKAGHEGAGDIFKKNSFNLPTQAAISVHGNEHNSRYESLIQEDYQPVAGNGAKGQKEVVYMMEGSGDHNPPTGDETMRQAGAEENSKNYSLKSPMPQVMPSDKQENFHVNGVQITRGEKETMALTKVGRSDTAMFFKVKGKRGKKVIRRKNNNGPQGPPNFEPPAQTYILLHGEDKQTSKSGMGVQHLSMDNLEESGEYNPSIGQGTSKTVSNIFEQPTEQPNKSHERTEGQANIPLTQESASGKCMHNKELSDVPSFPSSLETKFTEIEVHPRIRRRRHSDTEVSVDTKLSFASDKAVDMGENNEHSDEDAITVNFAASWEGESLLKNNLQNPPISPRAQKKSFLSVAAGEKSPLIPPTGEPFWYKDRPTAVFLYDEITALAQPFKFSMIEKFSKMPHINEIRMAFKGIGLVGAYEIKWLAYKHILIQLSNEHDLNWIWLKQVSFILNQKLRVFKWTPNFQSEKESSLVLIWISFPNLRGHLYEKSALLVIAKTVGHPLMVDEATAKGTRPSVARVCIEYDCQKPPIDLVWIMTRDRKARSVIGGYMQKVEFAKLPEYCSHCCHVGHGVSTCIVLRHQLKKRPQHTKMRVKRNGDEKGKEKPIEGEQGMKEGNGTDRVQFIEPK